VNVIQAALVASNRLPCSAVDCIIVLPKPVDAEHVRPLCPQHCG
jgi:hypothetical protein